jgi:hypothetical protein
VQSSILGGKGFAKSLDNVFCKVDVAEARKSLLTETIVVSDDTPDKEVVLQSIDKHYSDVVRRCRSWWQDDLPFKWLFGRESIVHDFRWGSESAVPPDISCRQVPDVPEDDGSESRFQGASGAS